MADPFLAAHHRYLAHDFAVLRVRTGTTLRLVVKGEIDMATAPCLHDHIRELSADDSELVVLDFERVSFIDSSGLGVLLYADDELNGRLRIAISPAVDRLLEITATRDKLPIVSVGPEVRSPTRPVRARRARGGH